ncbi:hypothetical protein [Streptomyces sp. NPDC058457]|uniref:hypothetical protein n=1 Tax=Streptomyces sp. NPDC058457 TaxID=3346507 RepID=UPI00365A855A
MTRSGPGGPVVAAAASSNRAPCSNLDAVVMALAAERGDTHEEMRARHTDMQ